MPGAWAEGLSAAGVSLYDVLGLARRDASMHDIKVAYRREARRYHPDSRAAGLGEAESTRRFIAVQRAYAVLADPLQRAQYDRQLLHPRVTDAGNGRSRRGGEMGMGNGGERRWRHGMRRPWMGQPMWHALQEQLEVKAAWREQWQQQLAGLRHTRAQQWRAGGDRGESWGAGMRRQRHMQGDDEMHSDTTGST
ncbi:hypothetical protein CLOM_g7956 [Closterium sp. NIES-68]|nr:hypothetical protein CLOM_g7956 [Closterium sp. NIES-68]GJP86386.1 hypothetical protein CLOP_g16411 [Closterium sp. NIES-67]